MTDPPPFHDDDLFDEAGYARLYPGLAEAVMRGTLDSLWFHYVQHGRAEGRPGNDVDPAFYRAAYPEMAQDLDRPPEPGDAAAHYVTLGRARGYLPHAAAPRPANGAAPASPFGVLWTDQANALDLIEGRRALGRIGARQAAWLRRFALDGFSGMEEPAGPDRTEAAARAVDQAFAGGMSDLLFDCPELDPAPLPWREEMRGHPVSVLDPHMAHAAIRALACDPAVAEALSLLFDAPPRLVASAATLGRALPPSRDVARLALSLPLGGAAVRFSLGESTEGKVVVWPASHHLPDLPFADGSLTAPDGQPDAAWTGALFALLRDRPALAIPNTAGGRVIRHLALAHAAEAAGRRATLTAWYCPAHVAPCYQERMPVRWHAQGGMAFASGVYPGMEPGA